MLTAQQIRETTFAKSLGNYKAAEVDQFVSEVAATVEAMTKKQEEDRSKMEILAAKLMDYRNQEENIQNALLNAQRSADSIVREAKQSAELTLQDMEIKRDQALEDMERKIAEKQEEYDRLNEELSAEYEEKNAALVAEYEEKNANFETEYAQKSADARTAYEADLAKQDAKIAEKRQELIDLKDQVATFRDELLEQYKQHLKLIDMLPGEKAPEEDELFAEKTETVAMPELVLDVPEVALPESELKDVTAAEPEIIFDVPEVAMPESKLKDATAAEPEIIFDVPEVAMPESELQEKPAAEPEVVLAETPVEEAPVEETPAPAEPESAPEAPVSDAVWPDDEIEDLPADKEDRFADLQFGDNYDVGGFDNPFNNKN